LVNSSLVKCDVNMDACQTDRFRDKVVADYFVKLLHPDTTFTLDVTTRVDRAEIWQLMRAAPLIDQKYFTRIIAILNKADNEAAPVRDGIRKYVEQPTLYYAYDDQLKALEYGNFISQQSRGVWGMVRAVCSFNNLIKELETGKDTKDYDEQSVTCPPESTTFDDFFQHWRWSRDREFKEPTPK
jgi:hypothetical protein